MKNLFWSFAVLALLIASAPAAPAEVETGKAAPDTKLTDTKNQSHQLADFKGKFVVLEWFNPGCPFVKKHYDSGNMQALQKEYTDKGVVWISINSSAANKEGHVTANEAERWMKEKGGTPSYIVLDSSGDLARRFGAKTTPHMFVIDPKGALVYQGAIDDKPGFDPDEIKGARNYVKAALDESLAGKPVTVASTKSYGCSIKY